jgi:hypothetical protein
VFAWRAGQLQAAYTPGATGVAAQTVAGRTAYYAQDALGSTRALMDGAAMQPYRAAGRRGRTLRL